MGQNARDQSLFQGVKKRAVEKLQVSKKNPTEQKCKTQFSKQHLLGANPLKVDFDTMRTCR